MIENIQLNNWKNLAEDSVQDAYDTKAQLDMARATLEQIRDKCNGYRYSKISK